MNKGLIILFLFSFIILVSLGITIFLFSEKLECKNYHFTIFYATDKKFILKPYNGSYWLINGYMILNGNKANVSIETVKLFNFKIYDKFLVAIKKEKLGQKYFETGDFTFYGKYYLENENDFEIVKQKMIFNEGFKCN